MSVTISLKSTPFDMIWIFRYLTLKFLEVFNWNSRIKDSEDFCDFCANFDIMNVTVVHTEKYHSEKGGHIRSIEYFNNGRNNSIIRNIRMFGIRYFIPMFRVWTSLMLKAFWRNIVNFYRFKIIYNKYMIFLIIFFLFQNFKK